MHSTQTMAANLGVDLRGGIQVGHSQEGPSWADSDRTIWEHFVLPA